METPNREKLRRILKEKGNTAHTSVEARKGPLKKKEKMIKPLRKIKND